MAKVIISPIFYMGNKRKLIQKGLCELFPKKINTFYDLFSGSAIISMNTKANKYVINDINESLIDLYNMFKTYNADDIIKHIEHRITEFNLPTIRTKRNVFDDKTAIEIYKNSYMKFRDCYNENPNILDLYSLSFYSFSQIIRFNKDGKFNMPFGNDCFSEVNKQYIYDGNKFFNKKNVIISNKDFSSFDISGFNSDDFVYLDPPYNNTTAVYNENRQTEGWSNDDQTKLYKFCDSLNDNNIKFGMSNVFSNKDISNTDLIKWSDKYFVHHFNTMSYTACGKGNANTDEVFITNYKIKRGFF